MHETPFVQHGYSNASPAELRQIANQVQPAIAKAQRVRIIGGYSEEAAFINLPDDKELLKTIQITAKHYKNIDAIIVVGIGGSNLGTIAVQEAVLGKLYNELPRKTPAIYYADTVDPANIGDILQLIGILLQQLKKVLVNIVTKLGTTTETVANTEVFIRLLQKHHKNWKDDVVVTTDEGSKLWHLAKQLQLTILEIPKSTDLHSMSQLDLSGPRDKFTTFVTIKKRPSQCCDSKTAQRL